jgi:hypothetical protein
MDLLASADGALSCTDRETLTNALTSIRSSHDASKNAWTMRQALDNVYASASP